MTNWIPRNKIHGLSYSKFYKTYHHIKQRCNNPKATKYHLWGGKGIKCLWKSFADFKSAMYSSYLAHVKKFGEANTTIERLDGGKGYSTDNCKWATYKEQNTNRTSVVKYKGLSITQWADKLKVNRVLIYTRIKRGWSIKEAIYESKRTYMEAKV